MSRFDLAAPDPALRTDAGWRPWVGPLHRRFLEASEPGRALPPAPILAMRLGALADALLRDQGAALTQADRTALVNAVSDEIAGLGPLEPLLADPTVTEILVNGPHQVYFERAGRLFPADCAFEDAAHVRRIIDRILTPLGRRIDEASPMADGRLPDGSRVNAVLPPLAVHGPALTIRKFSETAFTLSDLIAQGTLTPEAADFLTQCVGARRSLVISGGSGSGKTTTLNALSAAISPDERIITIEDAAELRLQQPHVVTLESRPPNLEGRGEITIRQLVRNALRMRPDRLLIGEVRGGECLDLLAAFNTGHDGSLTTVHANSPRHVLSRLETMTLMAGAELPLRAVREQIASAIHLIVHQARLRGGERRVTQITELHGLEGETAVLQDLFVWTGNRLRPTGLRPRLLDSGEV